MLHFLKHLYKTAVTEAVHISRLYGALCCYCFLFKKFLIQNFIITGINE